MRVFADAGGRLHCRQLQFLIHGGHGNSEAFRAFIRHLMLGSNQPIFAAEDGH
jgi:hypothetical protein